MIYKKFRAQRIRAGFTQKELAQRMGINRTTIYLVETGKQEPSPRFRRQALEILSQIIPDLTMDDLFYLPDVLGLSIKKRRTA